MARQIMPHLMFTGDAEEAMAFYVSLFPNSAIRHVERYGPEGPGPAGSVKMARFTVGALDLFCIDSPVRHAFGFTPSISLYVECADEAEFEGAFRRLAEGGAVLMPPADYGFSVRFAWATDRFGVSWQLNLARSAGGDPPGD